LGTGVGVGVGIGFGAVPGAVAGGSFWAGQQMYDGALIWAGATSSTLHGYMNNLIRSIPLPK